jgi:protein-S-isoprenylcysteine O-methyltransferase Ste14
MYLGELILRTALVVTSPQPLLAGALLVALVIIQIARALREERIIDTYSTYSSRVRYRLIPGVW